MDYKTLVYRSSLKNDRVRPGAVSCVVVGHTTVAVSRGRTVISNLFDGQTRSYAE